MDRRKEQSDLVLKIGMVFGPMVRVAENPEAVDNDEKRRIMARFQTDINQLEGAARQFMDGEPGHAYREEFRRIHTHTHFMQSIEMGVFSDSTFPDRLQDAQRSILQNVTSIPISESQEVFAAQSPFAAHCYLRNLCATVSEELHWQDRYFDHTVFDRYLSIVPEGVQITLVTWPESICKGKKDEARYQSFMDVSRLFAAERGVNGYRLIAHETFHARWLRCDGRLYTHDDSIKDLGKGKSFTIKQLSSTPENRQHFDDPISTGTELFGPRQSVHQ